MTRNLGQDFKEITLDFFTFTKLTSEDESVTSVWTFFKCMIWFIFNSIKFEL